MQRRRLGEGRDAQKNGNLDNTTIESDGNGRKVLQMLDPRPPHKGMP